MHWTRLIKLILPLVRNEKRSLVLGCSPKGLCILGDRKRVHKVDFGSGSHVECSQILLRISRF